MLLDDTHGRISTTMLRFVMIHYCLPSAKVEHLNISTSLSLSLSPCLTSLVVAIVLPIPSFLWHIALTNPNISNVVGHQNWGPNFQHLEVEPLHQSDAAVGCLATHEPKRLQETERDDLGQGGYIGISLMYGKSMNLCHVYVESDFSHGILVPKKHPKTRKSLGYGGVDPRMLDEVLPRSWPIASSQPMPLLLQHHFFFPWPSYSHSESISESWCWNDAISMGFPAEENAQVCGNMMILSNLTCCVRSLSGWPCAQPPGTGPTCHVLTPASLIHIFPGRNYLLARKTRRVAPAFLPILDAGGTVVPDDQRQWQRGSKI